MNGRQAKKVRREARRIAEHRLRELNPVTEPKPWFRLYCRWAKLRAYFGIPITPERMNRVSRRGVRYELRPNIPQGGSV